MARKYVDDLIDNGDQPPVKGTPEWDSLVARIEEHKGRTICARPRTGGTTDQRYRGWPCEAARMSNGGCRVHGGKVPAPGPTHPSFKHGRYSKVLAGTSLSEMYEQARTDPTLLSLEEEIAVLVARQQQTIGRMSKGGESRGAWKALSSKLSHLTATIERHRTVLDDERKMHAAEQRIDSLVQEMRQLLTVGLDEFRLWDEYDNNSKAIRRLVDTERRYREGQGLSLPPERANLMMLIVSEALRRTVPREYLPQFEEEVKRLRGATGPETSGPTPHRRELLSGGREIEMMPA